MTLKVKAVPYYKLVSEFAKRHNLPFFTVAHQHNAIILYEANAAKWN